MPPNQTPVTPEAQPPMPPAPNFAEGYGPGSSVQTLEHPGIAGADSITLHEDGSQPTIVYDQELLDTAKFEMDLQNAGLRPEVQAPKPTSPLRKLFNVIGINKQ